MVLTVIQASQELHRLLEVPLGPRAEGWEGLGRASVGPGASGVSIGTRTCCSWLGNCFFPSLNSTSAGKVKSGLLEPLVRLRAGG